MLGPEEVRKLGGLAKHPLKLPRYLPRNSSESDSPEALQLPVRTQNTNSRSCMISLILQETEALVAILIMLLLLQLRLVLYLVRRLCHTRFHLGCLPCYKMF